MARVTQVPTAAHLACLPRQVKVEQSLVYTREKAREASPLPQLTEQL